MNLLPTRGELMIHWSSCQLMSVVIAGNGATTVMVKLPPILHQSVVTDIGAWPRVWSTRGNWLNKGDMSFFALPPFPSGKVIEFTQRDDPNYITGNHEGTTQWFIIGPSFGSSVLDTIVTYKYITYIYSSWLANNLLHHLITMIQRRACRKCGPTCPNIFWIRVWPENWP